MKNTKYELIGIAILLIGGYFIYKKAKETKELSNNPTTDELKSSYIDTILADKRTTSGDRATLETFSSSYLKDWARAVTANQAVFTSSGVKYNLIGGKKV